MALRVMIVPSVKAADVVLGSPLVRFELKCSSCIKIVIGDRKIFPVVTIDDLVTLPT